MVTKIRTATSSDLEKVEKVSDRFSPHSLSYVLATLAEERGFRAIDIDSGFPIKVLSPSKERVLEWDETSGALDALDYKSREEREGFPAYASNIAGYHIGQLSEEQKLEIKEKLDLP